MSEEEDKAKKLKEIQDRLAEIQRKPKEKSTSVSKVSSPAKKEDPIKEVKANPANTPNKTTESPSPSASIKTKKDTTISTSEKGKNLQMTQEEKNWRANKIKAQANEIKNVEKSNIEKPKTDRPKKEKKSGSKKSKLSLVYTIISLVITISIVGYIVNKYFINSVSEEIVTSKLPEEIIAEEPAAESVMEDAEEINEEIVAEEIEEEITESNEEVAETIREDVKEEKSVEQPPESTRRRASVQKTDVPASIPSGIVISYASNSTKEMALKNVSTLKNKGFKAGYYYMPDKDAESPKLYKVYVGPYSDESSAMPDFKKVVDLNPKAFILRMN